MNDKVREGGSVAVIVLAGFFVLLLLIAVRWLISGR